MVKISFTRLHGCQQFWQRLLLSTLSNNPIVMDDILWDDTSPGLRPYEISLLRLFKKLSYDCVVEINETAMKLKYKSGVLLRGKNLTHDCGLSRSIGWSHWSCWDYLKRNEEDEVLTKFQSVGIVINISGIMGNSPTEILPLSDTSGGTWKVYGVGRWPWPDWSADNPIEYIQCDVADAEDTGARLNSSKDEKL